MLLRNKSRSDGGRPDKAWASNARGSLPGIRRPWRGSGHAGGCGASETRNPAGLSEGAGDGAPQNAVRQTTVVYLNRS